MTTLMPIMGTCPLCDELQPRAKLTPTPVGLVCEDRAACAHRQAIRLALLPPRREGAEGAQETA